MALKYQDYHRVKKGEPGYSATSAKYRSASTGATISGRAFTTAAKGGMRYETLVKTSPAKTLRTIGPKLPPKVKAIQSKIFDILAYLPGWKKERIGKSTRYIGPNGESLSPAYAKQVAQGTPLQDVLIKANGGKRLQTAWHKARPQIRQAEFLSIPALARFVRQADITTNYTVSGLGQLREGSGGSGGDTSGKIKWRGHYYPSPPYGWHGLGTFSSSVKYPEKEIEARAHKKFSPSDIHEQTILVYTITF